MMTTTERCECCGQKIRLAKCKHIETCEFIKKANATFPDCLCGDGEETPFTGNKIKTTEEALKKRGWGICSNYKPNINITQRSETIEEILNGI